MTIFTCSGRRDPRPERASPANQQHGRAAVQQQDRGSQEQEEERQRRRPPAQGTRLHVPLRQAPQVGASESRTAGQRLRHLVVGSGANGTAVPRRAEAVDDGRRSEPVDEVLGRRPAPRPEAHPAAGRARPRRTGPPDGARRRPAPGRAEAHPAALPATLGPAAAAAEARSTAAVEQQSRRLDVEVAALAPVEGPASEEARRAAPATPAAPEPKTVDSDTNRAL